jgi:DNA repair exonuclease SbcCD ATPase subunit
MTSRRLSTSTFVIAGAIVTLAAGYTAKATSQAGPPPDPITALLSEVHALRIAMEQTATMAPRVQLTLARLNIEEQRIAQLAAQLDQVRRELTVATLESQKLADQVPEVEKVLQTATDEKVRKSYEYEHEALKRKLAAQARLEQQLRNRENEAAQAVATEQGRWMDLNSRLDELERLLGPIPR